jgi:hypothetical protein
MLSEALPGIRSLEAALSTSTATATPEPAAKEAAIAAGTSNALRMGLQFVSNLPPLRSHAIISSVSQS